MTGRPTRGVARPDTDTIKAYGEMAIMGLLILGSVFLALSERYEVATWLMTIAIFIAVVDIRNDIP